jgi:hypothetical protein
MTSSFSDLEALGNAWGLSYLPPLSEINRGTFILVRQGCQALLRIFSDDFLSDFLPVILGHLDAAAQRRGLQHEQFRRSP